MFCLRNKKKIISHSYLKECALLHFQRQLQRKEAMEKILLKARRGFDKVHWEIKNIFIKKAKTPPKVHPKPTKLKPKISHNSESTQLVNKKVKKRSNSETDLKQTVETRPREMVCSQERENTAHIRNTTHPLSPLSTTEKDTSESTPLSTDEEYLIPIVTKPNRPNLPLPETPSNIDNHDNVDPAEIKIHQYDYPDFRDLTKAMDVMKKGYVGVDVTESDRVSREGQTANDFYQYTMDEVVQCFKLVALPDVAEICKQERFDGKFFELLSQEEIKSYFDLKQLHLVKVIKTIEGWRPK